MAGATFKCTLQADAGAKSCCALKSFFLSSLASACALCCLQGLEGLKRSAGLLADLRGNVHL